MDLRFCEMSVNTKLVEEYFKKNSDLLELYNNYNDETLKKIGFFYNGKEFSYAGLMTQQQHPTDIQKKLLNMASSLKENATLITHLEYSLRDIPIEDTNVQLNLLIQYLKYLSQFPKLTIYDTHSCSFCYFKPDASLLEFGNQICWLRKDTINIQIQFSEIAPICHLLVTLMHDAGYKNVTLKFLIIGDSIYAAKKKRGKVGIAGRGLIPVKDSHLYSGLDSGTVAVISDDADVDSAVDKLISVSIQVPWRLRRILVQESVYQTFKDALRWKCNLKKNNSVHLIPDVLCSESLSYKRRAFLLDPVEVLEHKSSVVTVEAYRTTKEMIDLVQQDKPYYLSLWTNGIAEINEVTHSTEAPLVWVNNLADFRGPLEVSAALFADINSATFNPSERIKKCAKVAELCKLSQSWLSLDFERRRAILCGALDNLISSYPTHEIYTELKNTFSEWTLNSFVDVGKDYVCVGMLRPRGIIATLSDSGIFTVQHFKSILLGNALIVYGPNGPKHQAGIAALKEAGVPVVYVNYLDIQYYGCSDVLEVSVCNLAFPMRIRVSWTNSGTIFAN